MQIDWQSITNCIMSLGNTLDCIHIGLGTISSGMLSFKNLTAVIVINILPKILEDKGLPKPVDAESAFVECFTRCFHLAYRQSQRLNICVVQSHTPCGRRGAWLPAICYRNSCEAIVCFPVLRTAVKTSDSTRIAVETSESTRKILFFKSVEVSLESDIRVWLCPLV